MDHTYISRVLAGDVNEFQYLVDKYKDVMLAAAFRICKNQTAAEDVLQESFLKAYKNLKSFRGDAKFSTWLYKIVVNEALQKQRKQDKHQPEISEGEIEGGDINSSLDSLKIDEQSKYIDFAMKKLNSREALVLQLFYLDELSLKEVADIMEVKSEHVKVLLYRARKQFYNVLSLELRHEIKSLI